MSLFESIVSVWIVWLGSITLYVVLSRRLVCRRVPGCWKHLLVDESGAAYVLSVVMVLPFYVLLICVILETTLIIVVKLGTTYSAFSAARAAIVWDVSESTNTNVSLTVPPVVTRKMSIRAAEAARLAMVPFASGSSLHSQSRGGDQATKTLLDAYHRRALNSDVNDMYLARKFQYARDATRVTVGYEGSSDPVGMVKATVTYDYPFQIPAVGRLFGAAQANHGRPVLVFQVSSTCLLQTEAPRNREHSLGIDYFPD